jgi:hypothetical protein
MVHFLWLEGQIALINRLHHCMYSTVNNKRSDTCQVVINKINDLKSKNYTILEQRRIREGLKIPVQPSAKSTSSVGSSTAAVQDEMKIAPEPQIIFTEDQQKIITRYLQQIDAGLQDLRSGTRAPPQREQLLQLILGPPGAGKSVVLNYISNEADERALQNQIEHPIIITTGTTGAAASNLRPGSRTVHNQFGIKIDQTSHETNKPIPKLSLDALAKLKVMFQKAFSCCIDECSMLTSIMLHRVSERCKEITSDHTRPFGGLDITLVGDFSQLPPTGGAPLYKDAVDFHLEPHKFEVGTPKYLGTVLFQQFKVFKLDAIQRSGKDPDHNERLAKIRNDGVVNEDIINSLKVLSDADFPEFANAPIVVTSNAEINALLYPILVEFARSRGQCVLKWRKELTNNSKKKTQGIAEGLLDVIYEEYSAGTYQYFVCGADAVAYLTENISPSIGLGNGVPLTLHSLVFASEEEEKEVGERIRQSSPGDVVDISSSPPVYVNVLCEHLAVLPEERDSINSTMRGVTTNVESGLNQVAQAELRGVIIPLACAQKYDKIKLANKSELRFYRFPYDLGFVSTFHKIQGKTLLRIILQLNERCGNLLNLTLRSLLVGLSRVRMGDHIRIMPMHDSKRTVSEQLHYLMNLESCEHLNIWLSGIHSDGSWICPEINAAGNRLNDAKETKKIKDKERKRLKLQKVSHDPAVVTTAKVNTATKSVKQTVKLHPVAEVAGPVTTTVPRKYDGLWWNVEEELTQGTNYINTEVQKYRNRRNVCLFRRHNFQAARYIDSQDISSLYGSGWLTGSIINAFTLLCGFIRPSEFHHINILSTALYVSLYSAMQVYNFNNVFNMTLRWEYEDLFNDIIIPVHLPGHWILIYFKHNAEGYGAIYVLDPLRKPNAAVVRNFKQWYKDVWHQLHTKFNQPLLPCSIHDWTVIAGNLCSPEIPKQRDGWNCGVYVCMYTYHIVVYNCFPDKDIHWDADAMPYLRKWMAYYILSRLYTFETTNEWQQCSFFIRNSSGSLGARPSTSVDHPLDFNFYDE